MSRVIDMLRRWFGVRSSTSTLRSPDGWFLDWLGGSATDAGTRVTTTRALGLSPYYAGLRAISETVGSLPLHGYRIDGERRGSAHAWSYLWPFNQTAPFMTPYQTDNLRMLKGQPPHATPFNAALQREYGALGEEALAESDHQHADMYIRKGFAAGNGLETWPEDPRTWWLPPRSRAELYDWHGKLNAKLDGNWRTSNPALAARAQAMYDCWVEQEHEDVWTRQPLNDPNAKPYQPEDIAKCKNGFLAAMQGPARRRCGGR